MGLRQYPAIDPVDVLAEATVLSAGSSAPTRARRRLDWFWGAGSARLDRRPGCHRSWPRGHVRHQHGRGFRVHRYLFLGPSP